jgi:hypothetical protein
MKCINFNRWLFTGKAAALLALVSASLAVSTNAQATPAFARQTGAECQKCHSPSYPRLNWTGERFMRNGFALPKSAEELDIGFPGDEGESEDDYIETKGMWLLKDIGKLISVRGKMNIYERDESSSDSESIGSPIFFAIFASSRLAPDVPLWAEAEINTDSGETDVHNYFVGWTNVLKYYSEDNATLVNFRAGGFTPTEWTSWSDQKRSLDSASSHPGAYRGRHRFTQVGRGLGTKTGLEYYGYKDLGFEFLDDLFWAVGGGNATGGNFDNSGRTDQTEYWLIGRADFLSGSSVSFLYMDYNNLPGVPDSDVKSYTVSGNWRLKKVAELRAQYSWDNSGTGPIDDVSGYGIQGDWHFARNWTAIMRYDTTDNGMAVNPDETQFTAALSWIPWQNIKLTASWVNELERADFSNGNASGGDEDDTYSLQLQIAM